MTRTPEQRQRIADATRAALAAKKQRGEGARLGIQGRINAQRNHAAAVAFAARMRPIIEMLRAEGMTLAQIAAALNANGIPTASGCGRWSPGMLSTVISRFRLIGVAGDERRWLARDGLTPHNVPPKGS